MSLPKIAEALIPRAIPDHKMWFNPLAPVSSDDTEPKPDATPTTRKKPSKSAPIKDGEAIVPKPEPELPKVIVIAPQTPPLSHNL